ncbi:MAG: DUF6356 family protein [Alphaproteobacteria bacterium]|nr:DUF6356 family protein [Alphaproteobacteria bacterium]
MRITEHFTQHPASVGETYGEHFRRALGFAIHMLIGGLACLVHAVLPFLFVKTGSRIIHGLHDRMVVNRHAASKAKSRASGTGRG